MLLDGQNLFEPQRSFAGSWNVPSAIDALDAESGGAAPVVVGVPNAGARRIWEYAPFRDRRFGGGGASRYLGFLLRTVVPEIEATLRVDRRPESRGLGGASLGGLFSLWAHRRAHHQFGRILAMSPTTLFAGEALHAFLSGAPFAPGRIWLDCGGEEGRRRKRKRPAKRPKPPRAPTAYVERVRRLRRVLETSGYVRGRNLHYREEPGGVHHESSWARRLPAALGWLYGDPPRPLTA